jgi:hypothetical protein
MRKPGNSPIPQIGVLCYHGPMSQRIALTIDGQGRMSVGKLGLSEGHAVAEPLPDASGWVIRQAHLVTEAEFEILSRPSNVSDLERALEDVTAGRVSSRRPRRN